MKYLLISFLTLCFISCGHQTKNPVIPVEESAFNQYINQKSLPKDPNINQEITILNRDYPIEIILYKDHKWFYDLPNLGKGKGTWEYKDGKIVLFAKRSLFNLNIDILATTNDAKEVAIQFVDRFGFQSLKMEKTNSN